MTQGQFKIGLTAKPWKNCPKLSALSLFGMSWTLCNDPSPLEGEVLPVGMMPLKSLQLILFDTFPAKCTSEPQIDPWGGKCDIGVSNLMRMHKHITDG